MNLKIQEITTLYHGTAQPHGRIDLSHSNRYKDFGVGYYLTSYFSQAASWARSKLQSNSLPSCYIYEYTLRQPVPITTLNIKQLLQYDVDWLDYVVKHRVHGQPDEFDIVYDRMADNFYDVLVQAVNDYVIGKISAQAALNIIRFQNPQRDQYCFKTRKAVQLLTRVHCYRSFGKNCGWTKLY